MNAKPAADRLLDHQRAELNRAGLYRIWGLLLQITVAAIAAASVFADEHNQLLILAATGVLLLVAWFVVDQGYRRHRAAGDQARRLLLNINGLGETVGDLHVIESSFTASTDKLTAQSIDSYFASRAPAGYSRLGEMLDESAFFTGDLQRRSAQFLFSSLLILGGFTIAVGLLFGRRLGGDGLITVARVVLSFLVLVVSSDVLGAAFGHQEAHQAMEKIRGRLSGARQLNYPQGDVLQAMADYNAAVEGAFMPIAFLYAMRRRQLTQSWNTYKSETGLGRAGVTPTPAIGTGASAARKVARRNARFDPS